MSHNSPQMTLAIPYGGSSCRSHLFPNSMIASTVPNESAPSRSSLSCLATTPIARIVWERERPIPCVRDCSLMFGNHRRLPHARHTASPTSSNGSMDTTAPQTGQRLGRLFGPSDRTIAITLSTSDKTKPQQHTILPSPGRGGIELSVIDTRIRRQISFREIRRYLTQRRNARVSPTCRAPAIAPR